MRVIRSAILAVAAVGASSFALVAQPPEATAVLTAARESLGGDKNLAAVKTIVATGRTRQLRGNNLVPIEFEISCELPDRFVRKDEIPAQDTDLTVTGFSGDVLIQFPPPSPGRGGPPPGGRSMDAPGGNAARGGPPPGDGRGRGGIAANPAQQRLAVVKQDFARLMLGSFAASFPSYPLSFTYAAIGEAPEGKADILDVTGPADFSARFVVQRETHLPVMLTWQLPATNVIVRVPGQPGPAAAPPGAVVVDAPAPPPATASAEDRDQYAATVANLRRQALTEAKPTEYRMYYADYRDVNHLKWPFRIRRAIGGVTVEETTFDQVRFNVKIDPRKFESPK